MNATKNLYAVLGLTWGAGEPQVKAAYRQLAKSSHPDLHPDDPEAADRFKEIVAAYWVLSDPARRSAYLRDHAAQNGGFEHFFRQARRWAEAEVRPDVPEVGQDILIRLHLTLEEIASGVVKKVKIRRRSNCSACGGSGVKNAAAGDVCPACHGSGRVPDLIRLRRGEKGATIVCRKCDGAGQAVPIACPTCGGHGRSLADHLVSVGVPAGVEDHYKLVVKGQGHEGLRGGEPGDLKVVVQQKQHPYLERRGADLSYTRPITLSQWLEGVELRVPSLNGEIRLKIEPNMKPEGMLKISGRGLPQSDGSRGDLLVQYHLCIPKKLTKKQLALLKRLEETPDFAPTLDAQGFLRKHT